MANERMKSRIVLFLVSIIMLAAAFVLGYKVTQSDFPVLLSFYVLFFFAYLGVCHFVEKKATVGYFIGLGIVLRFVLLFAFPSLSDDIYRFIWDGQLAINGINPFNHLPSYFIDHQIQVPGITPLLYAELNSPNYYTVYPPVCQGIFALSCQMFPEHWAGSAIVMKSFLFVFECGSVLLIWKLLKHFRQPEKRILLYALNPLVIVEIMGNLHFEGAMIFFMLLAVWFLVKSQYTLSAVSIAFSIASKLLPLLLLPLLIKRLGWKRSFRYFTITGIALLILFLPLLNPVFLENFSNSLDLYFRKFEFNASVYYILRWLGNLITGYNQIDKIGPFLAFLVLIGVVYRAYKEKHADYQTLWSSWLYAISIYLMLATTVHPWYLILPVTLCIFTPFRFPILWSGVVILTYINYSYPEYFENLWTVSLEYIMVLSFLLWEIRTRPG